MTRPKFAPLIFLVQSVAMLAACGGSDNDVSGRPAPPLSYFTVTATAGSGGTVTPASQRLLQGSPAQLSVSPQAGYQISSVSGCNGTLNGQTYQTAPLAADCTVTALFDRQSYSVTATAGAGGSISPAQQQVGHGSQALLQLSPQPGFVVGQVSGCGGSLNGLSYRTGDIVAPCQVQASFRALQAPIAVIKADAQSNDNSLLLLDGSASSSDPSQSLVYQWQLVTDSNIALTLAQDTGNKTQLQIPDLMEDHQITLRLTVTDGTGASASTEQQIALNNAGHNHNLLLRVVRVTPDWMPYASTDGWTQAATQKESEFLKYFEVAIWEETASVHLYAFPDSYDPLYGLHPSRTDAEKIAYREQHALLRFDGLPAEAQWMQRNDFLLEVFAHISAYLVKAYPNSDHHLMYNGHGAPGGELFENMLTYEGAGQLLATYRQQLGRKLGVIDMGGPCNKGSFSDVENFCRHARYYVASDLENGGYQFDHWDYQHYLDTHPEYQYHRLFARKDNLKAQLKERIDITQQRYQYAWQDMINRRLMQANYLYSCDEFSKFKPLFIGFIKPLGQNYQLMDDLKQFMLQHQADSALLQAFERVILQSASNKTAFDWPQARHGMLMPAPWLPLTPD